MSRQKGNHSGRCSCIHQRRNTLVISISFMTVHFVTGIVHARLAELAAAVPQRKRRSPPRTASCPQAADERAPGTLPSPIMPASTRPTSRPSMYPAEKLIAENRTTTPALITHVMIVGLTGPVESDILARRLFLGVAVRSLGDIDRRLALAIGGPGVATARGLRRGGPTEGLVSVYRGE